MTSPRIITNKKLIFRFFFFFYIILISKSRGSNLDRRGRRLNIIILNYIIVIVSDEICAASDFFKLNYIINKRLNLRSGRHFLKLTQTKFKYLNFLFNSF